MEAMGNAQTSMNNNSSRFGKLLDIHFSSLGRVSGADFRIYLLEKTRVVTHGPGERSYHSLYMLFQSGADVREKLQLSSSSDDYAALKKPATAPPAKQTVSWRAFDKAFDDIGVPLEDKSDIYTILALVLHLSNLTFNEEAAHGADGSSILNDSTYRTCVQLLRAEEGALDEALTVRIGGGGVIERFKKPLTVPQAHAARDACCMQLYLLAFNWCIDILNDETKPKQPAATFASIGILDVFEPM